MSPYLIIFGSALIDLTLQPLYPGWIWIMPIALLFLIMAKPSRHRLPAIIIGTMWCDIWSGYSFGVVSVIFIIVYLVISFAGVYFRIPSHIRGVRLVVSILIFLLIRVTLLHAI